MVYLFIFIKNMIINLLGLWRCRKKPSTR